MSDSDKEQTSIRYLVFKSWLGAILAFALAVVPVVLFLRHGTLGDRFVSVCILGTEALALVLAVHREWSYLKLTILVVAVFLVAGATGSVLFAWHDEYCVPFSTCWWQHVIM